MKNEQITSKVIGAAMRVHSRFGPGLLENAYRLCVAHLLRLQGLDVQTEVPVSVEFEGLVIETGFRIDLLVDNCVVVELKTVTKLAPVHHAQLLSYLRLTNQKTGLLINFHVARLRDGIKRISN